MPQFSLTAALTSINLTRRTGCLFAENKGRKVSLFFDQGMLVYASANDPQEVKLVMVLTHPKASLSVRHMRE